MATWSNILLENESFKLEDANSEEKKTSAGHTVTLKAVIQIRWLPPSYETAHIEQTMKRNFPTVKINSIHKETAKEEICNGRKIFTGVIRLKIEYNLDFH